jgi:Tol biopolymer transport system component
MDAFLYDFTTGAVERVSVSAVGAEGNAQSYATSMTPDARYVAFHSDASNLSPRWLPEFWTDVFVRDRQAGTTTQISRGPS